MHPEDGVVEVKEELYPQRIIVVRDEDCDPVVFVVGESIDDFDLSNEDVIGYYELVNTANIKVTTEVIVEDNP